MSQSDIRFRNRRRMAWISFGFIILFGAYMLEIGLRSDEGAARVEKLSFLIGTVFGVCTTIVVSYFTSSTVTQMNDTKFGPAGAPRDAGNRPPAPTPAPPP